MSGTKQSASAFKRVRGHLHRDGDVVPLRLHERAAQAHGGCEPDRMEHTVDATPSLGEVVANGIEMLGHRHVQLEHGRWRGQLAGRALGERKTSTRAGEHDLGPLLLRELRDAERERCIGEHAGDDDALSLEKTHGASDRRCGGDVTAEPGVQG